MSVTGMTGDSNMASLGWNSESRWDAGSNVRYCDRTDKNVDQSWAAKVTGKKDLSLKHPDQIIEAEMRAANQHPDSPDYGIKSGYYMNDVFVEDFEDYKPDHYVSPKPLSQMHQSMRKTFDECFDISLKKANDYSKGSNTYRNFEGSIRIGISVQKGIMLRMQDKFVRLENLLENDTPKVAESIEDTLMDLINYAAILKARREYEAAL
jgi:hypothetical protein